MNWESPRLRAERDAKVAALGQPPSWWRVFSRRRYDLRYRELMAMDISPFAELMREFYPSSSVAEMASRPDFGKLMKR